MVKSGFIFCKNKSYKTYKNNKYPKVLKIKENQTKKNTKLFFC